MKTTEKKILVYNKMKKGLSYEQACKELEKELKFLEKAKKKVKK